MGLAPSGNEIPQTNAGVQAGLEAWLFGARRGAPQSYQWQAPAPPKHPTTESLKDKDEFVLPSWLVNEQTTDSTTPASGLENVRLPVPHSTDKTAHSRRDQPDPQLELSKDLEQFESLEDLRSALKCRSIRRLEMELSSLVFQRLLARNTPIVTLLDFLGDPQLNFQEAGNLEALLANQAQTSPSDMKDEEMISDWMQSRVASGLLSFQRLALLLEVMHRASNAQQPFLFRERIYSGIFQGVRRCTIHVSGKAKEKLLYAIVGSISPPSISPALESLGWHIIGLSSISGGAMIDVLSSFTSSCLLADDTLPNPITSRPDVTKGIRSALDIITAFPVHVAEACIESISKKLVGCTGASKDFTASPVAQRLSRPRAYIERLGQWWTGLQDHGLMPQLQQRSGWQHLEHVLGSDERDVLMTYLQPMDDSYRSLFLIRHCYQPTACSSDLSRLRFRALAEAHYRKIREEHPQKSPLTCLLLTLRLAEEKYRVGNIQDIYEIVHLLRSSSTPAALAASYSVAHARINEKYMIREVNYFLEQNQPRIAYRLFQAFPTISLEHVPALAEAMIANPSLQTYAALHYRHRRQKWLKPADSTDESSRSLVQLRSQLLDIMAHAYARSPHSQSISFRKVYQCYLAARTDQLPVTAEHTKALTFAGVVRYLKNGEWVSTERYNRIYSLVKEVEGQKVADRLDDLVFFWRGKVLDQNMYRKRKERALGLPRGSLLMDEQPDPPHGLLSANNNRRKRMHWYKPYEPLKAGD